MFSMCCAECDLGILPGHVLVQNLIKPVHVLVFLCCCIQKEIRIYLAFVLCVYSRAQTRCAGVQLGGLHLQMGQWGTATGWPHGKDGFAVSPLQRRVGETPQQGAEEQQPLCGINHWAWCRISWLSATMTSGIQPINVKGTSPIKISLVLEGCPFSDRRDQKKNFKSRILFQKYFVDFIFSLKTSCVSND